LEHANTSSIDEYNTLQDLWVEAINTACYASNLLFLQKFLSKTLYELLNGKKLDISFFRMFGCKYYIYKKRQHLGKFQRRCDISFLAIGLIEETYDVEFDESNGSQGAHENLDDVGDESLREAMKNILVRDIKSKDDEDEVHVIDPPSSLSVLQDDDKDRRVENKDTHISHDQMVAQA
jgi:hypothetical protein